VQGSKLWKQPQLFASFLKKSLTAEYSLLINQLWMGSSPAAGFFRGSKAQERRSWTG